MMNRSSRPLWLKSPAASPSPGEGSGMGWPLTRNFPLFLLEQQHLSVVAGRDRQRQARAVRRFAAQRRRAGDQPLFERGVGIFSIGRRGRGGDGPCALVVRDELNGRVGQCRHDDEAGAQFGGSPGKHVALSAIARQLDFGDRCRMRGRSTARWPELAARHAQQCGDMERLAGSSKRAAVSATAPGPEVRAGAHLWADCLQ